MKKFEWGISVRVIATFVAVAVCLVVGCRRTDVRDFEVSIPKMTAESEPVIRQALAGFAGVEKPSLKFDQKAKKLMLRYDSMQLALQVAQLQSLAIPSLSMRLSLPQRLSPILTVLLYPLYLYQLL